MSPAPQFVSNQLEQCVRDIPDIAKGSDSSKLRTGEVSRAEKCGVIERCRLREPCPCAVKYTAEHCAPKVDLIVEVRLMEYNVSTEFTPMKVNDVVKSCTPKTDTPMEGRTVKVGAPLEDSLTEGTGTVEDGFIEINICLKEGAPKVHIFLEDDRPKIDDVFKRTPGARETLVEKNPVIFVTFQFDRKDINDAFNGAIRECNGGRITL